MTDPFFITGPAIISFSGGRTSAFMLWRILQAHGGTLPADVVVAFSNTGREMPKTLDFVAECALRWSVHVHWLEYRRAAPTEAETAAWRSRQAEQLRKKLERVRSLRKRAQLALRLDRLPTRTAPGRQWTEVVGHNSASREGEPFAMMLAGRGMLPNPVARFCTVELKIRTVKRWAVSDLGWPHWTSVVGIRADEAHWLENLPVKTKERWTNVHPLHAAGIDKADVSRFWRAQPFDLQLAGPWEGNCDGCFLKSRVAVERMFFDHQKQMAWWPAAEKRFQSAVRTKEGINLFRADREPYAVIAENVRDNPPLPFTWIEELLPCTTGGCGI